MSNASKAKSASASAPVAVVSSAEVTPAPAAAAPTTAVVSLPEEAAKQIEQAVAAGREAVETVVKTSQDLATQGYDQAAALTKTQVETAVQAQSNALHTYESAISSTKETLEAVVNSSQVFSRGLQELGKSLLGLAQLSVEEGIAVSKQMMAAKTLREVVDLQTMIVRSQLDRLLSEGSRLSDQSVQLVEDALTPLNKRVDTVVNELIKKKP